MFNILDKNTYTANFIKHNTKQHNFTYVKENK